MNTLGVSAATLVQLCPINFILYLCCYENVQHIQHTTVWDVGTLCSGILRPRSILGDRLVRSLLGCFVLRLHAVITSLKEILS